MPNYIVLFRTDETGAGQLCYDCCGDITTDFEMRAPSAGHDDEAPDFVTGDDLVSLMVCPTCALLRRALA